jgi:starvation-inducible outer membrane lipoprotein
VFQKYICSRLAAHSFAPPCGVLVCLVLGLLLPACAPTRIFPPEVSDKVDRTVSFENLIANPDHYKDRTVELGGQIVGSIAEQDEIHMLVRALPIRTRPYGPVDMGRLRGMFVIRFTGKIGTQDVQDGNMVVVIGTVMGAIATSLTGTPVRRPTVTAECFHIWRTQGNQIDDFPWLPNARYWPLIQQTYCVNKSNLILPVS